MKIVRQKEKYKQAVWTCLLLFLFSGTRAQKKDTLALLRQFASISTGYQQTPLYMSLAIKSSSNILTSEEDTMSVTGEFFLGTDNSYVHFGEFEQLVNDTLALMVSNKLQQMILYTNAKPVVEQMKKMIGAVLPDSSIARLAAQYSSSVHEMPAGNMSSITLENRTPVYGSTMAKESIELVYDKNTGLPQSVTTRLRTLVRLDEEQYNELSKIKEMAGFLIKTPEGSFLVKEKTTGYIYYKIEKAWAAPVPVLITDRIKRTEEGEYKPVEQYGAYRITIND